MHHLRGNAIPAGHVQKRFSLNLVSLRDSKNVPKIFLIFFLNFAVVFVIIIIIIVMCKGVRNT